MKAEDSIVCSMACHLCTRHMGFEKGSIGKRGRDVTGVVNWPQEHWGKKPWSLVPAIFEKGAFCFPFDTI